MGMGRQAARGQHRDRRSGQRLQRGPEPGRHDARPSAATASGWPATPGCACSTCPTPRSPRRASGRWPRPRACSTAGQPRDVANCFEAIFSKARQRDGMRAFESADRRRRRPPGDPRRPAGHQPRRVRGWRGSPRRHVQRLPGHDAREPARVPRALPLRRCRPQGGRRRQRRDALLHARARGARRERPADPPGQGGDRVGARAVPRAEPPRQPRPAGRGRPAGHAGHARTSSWAGPAGRAGATSTSASCGT